MRVSVLIGLAVSLAAPFTAWTWTPAFPGDLTVYGSPAVLQYICLGAAVLAALYALAAAGLPYLGWLAPRGAVRGLRWSSLAAAGATWFTLAAIAVELGGLVHLEPGGWAAGAGTALMATAACLVPDDTRAPLPVEPSESRGRRQVVLERTLITAICLGAMLVLNFGIATAHTEEFVAYLLAAALAVRALNLSGALAGLTALGTRNRTATAAGALVAAMAFPLAQTSGQYTSIAVNVLIFAAVALGLNIVVGLVGLLDLGYVAFLGVGAYTAALVSGSVYAQFSGARLPFWAAVLLAMAFSALAGVVIGAPTLRLHGDYLAIVTLGFGEIFRITVNNLDGTSGPALTRGPNGISQIPDLEVLGFDFGATHRVLGVELGRFANYYLLLLAVVALVVFVFTRVNESRIGRAWIALREDEKAATAMGIDGFSYKLLAFALGAALAGAAGAVQAHVTTTVVPESYLFTGTAPPNSAFLLAAVVLGGMGTVSGPVLGAALLYLVPAKFQFFQEYQLLLFGLTLILIMRFRPEGLIPNRRRQMELHS
ncbi:branched-chain amino acid ABC transporter permease [Nonomuraea zeae]|uniref:branched-chain amino acid ABC transporter permease n=1 Tax=Nonomuraea zeae TaxID=1642303 RepID=UPI00197F8F3F|nr:hypothetical protein [Nonomuraea zeae]